MADPWERRAEEARRKLEQAQIDEVVERLLTPTLADLLLPELAPYREFLFLVGVGNE